MFFCIGRDDNDNYPCQERFGSLVVSTDPGWTRSTIAGHPVLFKGYVDQGRLQDRLLEIIQQSVPMITGNFCVLIYTPDQGIIDIMTDRYRSFPLYYTKGVAVTNLCALEQVAWADSTVTVTEDLDITERKHDIIGSNQPGNITVDQIDHYLRDKIYTWLHHNDLPVKIFLSGGVDTTLLYSYVKAAGADHEVVWCSHIDHDYFYVSNHGDLDRHWAYRQIHHWLDDCVLVSGTPGDEFTMRSPATANLWLLAHGTDMPEQLAHNPDCLHHDYFSQPKHLALFQQQKQDWQPPDDLVWHLCNINTNDWQHWHLGRTLTWTPLRDLALFRMFLGLPYQQILAQILDSQVSINLIEHNQPGLSDIISNKKNTGNSMRNLMRLISQQ
jgi:hypothetical protein